MLDLRVARREAEEIWNRPGSANQHFVYDDHEYTDIGNGVGISVVHRNQIPRGCHAVTPHPSRPGLKIAWVFVSFGVLFIIAFVNWPEQVLGLFRLLGG